MPSGAANDPFYIDLGLITYLKMKASELLGFAMHAQKASDADLFIQAVKGDVLALPSKSVFQFTYSGNLVEPAYVVFSNFDHYSVLGFDAPFFCVNPYVPNRSVTHYLAARPRSEGSASSRGNAYGDAYREFKGMLKDPLKNFNNDTP